MATASEHSRKRAAKTRKSETDYFAPLVKSDPVDYLPATPRSESPYPAQKTDHLVYYSETFLDFALRVVKGRRDAANRAVVVYLI